MKYNKLAGTEIRVSAVGFGCWAIVGDATWGPQDETEAIAAMRAALDAGITLFDTAEMYGNGLSEQLIRKALGDRRDRVVLATKVMSTHLEPAALRQSCEQSLRNMGTDYIDLYQVHWPSRTIPFPETIGVLDGLRKSGKIRAYGISNFGPTDLKAFVDSGGHPVSNQMAYNLLFRAVEFEVQPLMAKHHISMLCYSPLMQGLLTGKFHSADDVPAGRARTRHYGKNHPGVRHGEPGAEKETFDAIAGIRKVADELREPMERVALAWLLRQPTVASAIAGARNPEQAGKNAAAADLVLPEAVVAKLAVATDPLKTRLGPNADMWQSESRIR